MLAKSEAPTRGMEFLTGAGEMATLVRTHDWSTTPLGPIETWPQSLRAVAGLVIGSPLAMIVLWGPDLVQIYNDGCRLVMGAKHPSGLGQPTHECWPEVREFSAPIYDAVLRGETKAFDGQKLTIERLGRPEEAWFDLTYSPLRDETGSVSGVLVTVIETTDRVLAAQRQQADTARQRRLFDRAPGFITILDGPEHRFEFVNDAYKRLFGDRGYVGRTVREAFPDLAGQGFYELLDGVYSSGERFIARSIPIRLQPTPDAPFDDRFLDFIYEPVIAEDGAVTGLFVEGYDVTEAHLAQEALRASETRLSAIFAQAKVGLSEISPDGRFVRVNDELCAMLGRSREELLSAGVVPVTHPEDIELSLVNFGRTIKAGEPTSFDKRYVRPDGTVVWANSSLTRLANGNGRLQAVLAVTVDLTERREAQEALRASEEFNRQILASSADCIKVLDLDGRLEFMSEGGMCVMEVNDFGSIQGRCWPDLWQGEGHTKAVTAIEEARRGGTGRFQGFATTMKGTPRWWDVIVTPITGPDGRPERLLSISRDITATKLAEEAVRQLNVVLEERVTERTEERDMLATIIETTDVLVMACDLDYNILASNKASVDEFERIYGVRPKAGDNILALLADQPEEQARVRAGWGRGLDGEEVTFVEDFGDPERERPYYEVKFRPLRNAAGECVGAYQFVTNVTERLRRERQLSQTQEQLRQAQKMEAVGQLTGGVAHDFNNLLTIIKSSTDLLRRPGLPEERRGRYVDAIAGTVDRAARLTGQLLAFARRQALKPEVFDAAERVRAVNDMLRTVVGSRIQIEAEINERCFIDADASQFETALVNMAVNARDAMDGEGTLTVSVRSMSEVPPLRGHAAAAGDFVAVSVSDTGSGIPADKLSQIFEPFFTTKEVGKGTGLGLSQVYGFAKQSGGDVAVESSVGQGSTFTIYLPRVENTPEEQAAPSRQAGISTEGRGRRVLVVEDNVEVGQFSTQLLQDLGYVTTWAANAAEALQLLQEQTDRFDVVFSDVVMPGMSGVELGEEIRRLYPGLPVVLTSGYSHVLAQERRHGFELLHKPYAAEELSRVLRRVTHGQEHKDGG